MSAPAAAERIIVVVPSLRCGGAERVASVLSRAWERAGADVTVCVFNGREQHYPVGGELVVLDLAAAPSLAGKARNVLARTGQLVRLLRAKRPTRVIAFSETANIPAVLACAWTGLLDRLTVSVRNNPRSQGRWTRAISHALYRWPERVVVGSRTLAAIMTEEFGVPAGRSVAIPNPIELGPLREAAGRPQEPAAFVPARPYVLAVGRLVPVKGFDTLITAFAEIAGRHEVDLLILGEGPERARLEAQAAALGTAGRVHLPGNVASPFPFMARATLVVLSSRSEGWPNVLIEAMAAGAPVIAADCHFGPAEIVQHGESGCLVPVDDAGALARALDQLLGDPVARQALGAAARLRSDGYDVDAIARQWVAPA